MALISCKDCAKEFSTDLNRCPNCGSKTSSGNAVGYVYFTLGAFFLYTAIKVAPEILVDSPKGIAGKTPLIILSVLGLWLVSRGIGSFKATKENKSANPATVSSPAQSPLVHTVMPSLSQPSPSVTVPPANASGKNDVIYFKNPQNGYIEIVDSPFLWTLLCGSFYFMVKRVYVHAIISAALAIGTVGISWVIYPFYARDVITRDYLRRGWIQVATPVG